MTRKMTPKPALVWTLLGMIALLTAWSAVQGVRIYPIAQRIRMHGTNLLALRDTSPDVILTGSALSGTRGELRELHRAMAQLQDVLALELGIASRLKWVPLIGGDIASVPLVLDAGVWATAIGDSMLTGLEPVARLNDLQPLEARAYAGDHSVIEALEQAGPSWHEALDSLDRLVRDLEMWETLPRGRIVAPRIDPHLETINELMPLARKGLEILGDSPQVIDALIGLSQPRRYLILLQNSWEMRPTGGFITAAVVVTVAAGQFELSPFVDSYRVDLDYGALPPPPTTLRNALWGAIWTFRDANWSADFPTSAAWARDLYLIGRDEEIDGVIGFDPAVVESLLGAVGPVAIREYETEVSAADLWDKLARFHDLPPGTGETESPEAAAIDQRKAFLPAIAEPLVVRLRQSVAGPAKLPALGKAISKSLHERHLLVASDDPTAARWLAEQGWDGSVWQGDGDYIQIVDSNVGFNKADARIQRKATYRVELAEDGSGSAQLSIEYHNSSTRGESECVQELVPGTYESGWLDACYWDYLRVYVPGGSQLIAADPSSWPEGSLWRRSNPAAPFPSVHIGRDGTGREVFGVLLAVPPGERRIVQFDYMLPQGAWTPTAGYRLYFQKQSGTIGMPVQVVVQPPDGMSIAGGDGRSLGGQVTVQLGLRIDEQIILGLEGEVVDRLSERPIPTLTITPTARATATNTPIPAATQGPSPTPVLLLITATPSAAAPAPSVTVSPPVVHPGTPVPKPRVDVLTWARVRAPAVGIDTTIVPVGWQLVGPAESRHAEWEVAAFAAGHHRDSALPGETGNVVLSGHHNILGEVFRDLWLLDPGDEIFLTDSAGTVYRYIVREVNILPDAGMPPEVRASYLRYLQRTTEPILTLVTCWPYESNTHRTIVVADLTG